MLRRSLINSYKSRVRFDKEEVVVTRGSTNTSDPAATTPPKPLTIFDVAAQSFGDRVRCEGGTIPGNGELTSISDAIDADDPMVVPYWHRHCAILPTPLLRILPEQGTFAYEDRPHAYSLQAPHIAAYFSQFDLFSHITGELIEDEEPTIIDCGANTGFFAMNLIALLREKNVENYENPKVYCIEPIPSTAAVLRLNLEQYEEDVRPVVLQYGASDVDGVERFLVQKGSSVTATSREGDAVEGGGGSGDVFNAVKEPIICEVRRLEHLINDHHIHKVHLLKIDVEGAELAVLHGVGTAWSRVDTTIVEVHTRSAARLPAVLEFLAEQGLGYTKVVPSVDSTVPLSLVFASRRDFC